MAFSSRVGGGAGAQEKERMESDVPGNEDSSEGGHDPVTWIRADDFAPDIQGRLNGEGRARYSTLSEGAGVEEVERRVCEMEASEDNHDDDREGWRDETSRFGKDSPGTLGEPCDSEAANVGNSVAEVGASKSRSSSSSSRDTSSSSGSQNNTFGSGGALMPPLPVPRRECAAPGLSEREHDDGKGVTRRGLGGDRGEVHAVAPPATGATGSAKRADLVARESPTSRTSGGNDRHYDYDDDGDDRSDHDEGSAFGRNDREGIVVRPTTGARNRDDRLGRTQPGSYDNSTTAAASRGESGGASPPPEVYQQPQPRIIELFRSTLASTSSSDSSGDHSPPESDRAGGDSAEEGEEDGLLQVSLGSDCTTDTFTGMQASLGSMMLR